MTPLLQAENHLLEYDSRGTIRVKGARIPLDTIVYASRKGKAPKEICEHFPALDLGSVSAAITYYFRHRAGVETYLWAPGVGSGRRAEADRGSVAVRRTRQRLHERLGLERIDAAPRVR